MEARSRDKLGQPIEELNPAVSERRDRVSPSPLLSSRLRWRQQRETGERWKNSHAKRERERGGGGVAGRGSGRKEGEE